MVRKIDALGEMCPIPLIKAKEVYAKMMESEILIIITDHSCVVSSIIDYFKHFKCEVIMYEVINGVWEIKIVRG